MAHRPSRPVLSRRTALRSLAPAALLPAIVPTLVGCQGSGGSSDGGSTAGVRTVATERGEEEIPDSPERVACVDWQMTPAMVDLGVVPTAIYEGFFEEDATLVAPQRYADALVEAERFGGYESFSYEALAGTEPQLILTAGVGLTEEDFARMEEIAPLVLLSSDGGWRALQGRLAEVLGAQDEFAALEHEYEQATDEVQEEHAELLSELTWASVGGGQNDQWFLEGGATPTGTLLSDLGGTFADSVDPAGYWSDPKSYENIGELETADVILFPADPAGKPVDAVTPLIEDELFRKLPAARSENLFGFGHSSVSSIEWAGDGIGELADIMGRVSR